MALDRYAKWLGLDPLHFAQGFSALRPVETCTGIWMQYDWQQSPHVSRHQLASLIRDAEKDIALHARYWPALVWISDEWQLYPRPFRREFYQTGLTRRGDFKPMELKWGYTWYGGQRAVTQLGTVGGVGYATLDADGDGFSEWAVFTILGVDSGLNVCEVKAYFKNFVLADATNTRTDPNSTGADPAWEIKPIEASLVGTTLTIRIPVWYLFRPQLQEALNAAAINADLPASYVDEIIFYREYNDPQSQVQFLWGEADCRTAACAMSVQDGCFDVRDPRNSIIVPRPGTWDAANAQFNSATWTEGREPDSVRFWYRAGFQPEVAPGCEPLTDYWANLIAILATARLGLPLCACSLARDKAEFWRTDVTMTDTTRSFQLGMDALECPLGHRRGEVHVWKALVGRPGLVKGKAVRL